MDNNTVNLTSISPVYNKQYQQQTTQPKTDVANNSIKDGDKKLNNALIALGLIGTAIAAGVCVYKHKNPTKATNEVKEQAAKLLSDVKFNKGVATVGNSKFTGTIADTLKNGDKITLEYVDGAIKKSTRQGKKNFVKTFETLENGNHKVITQIDGAENSVIIENLAKKAKKSQDELHSILKNKDQLSLEDFKKQTDNLTNVSKKQKEEIQQIINEKQKLIDSQKPIEQEKIKIQDYEKYKNVDISNPKNEEVHIFCKELPDEYPTKSSLSNYQQDLIDNNQHLTLDSKENLFSDFNNKDIYDVPEKMAIAADNSLRTKGNAFICDDVPEIFKGMDENEVCSSISSFLNNNNINEKYQKFSIAGKEFLIERVNAGEIGTVYKITDDIGHNVSIKYYRNPSLLGTNCGLQEIAVSRQATKEGVNNIPKFYMANASGYKPTDKERTLLTDSMWMMTDFIEKNAKAPKGGITLGDWMGKYNMAHNDMNAGSMIGDYIVDLGGIMPSIKSNAIKNRRPWDNGFSIYLLTSLQENGMKGIQKYYS